MLNIEKEVSKAAYKIRPYVRETPLEHSIALSKMIDAHVYLKCENLQHTGSFKIRGALNKLLSLSSIQRQKGIVTSSSGNHGAAVAFGAKHLKIPSIIFVPKNVSTTKAKNILNYGVPLEFYGTDCIETELYALEYAKQNDMTYISPYNDSHVIAGQGTIALELTQQLTKIDAVFVPIGGGGLISGISSYIKTISPKTQIIGCLPINSPVMAKSIEVGHILDMKSLPTFSDATAGGIEPGSITFSICQKYVDKYILVSEDQIKEALVLLLKTQHLLAEGASGVALASLLKDSYLFHNKNVVVVLSGANIGIDTLKKVLS